MTKLSLPPEQLGLAFALARPRSPVLVTSLNEDGSTNVAPFNWNTPISGEPPMLLLALQVTPRTSDTLINIRRTREFVVNMPNLEMAADLVAASYEHAPGVIKFEQIGFTAEPSHTVKPPAIAQARAQLECKLDRIIEGVGDHDLVIGQVVGAHYREEAFTEELTCQTDLIHPCIHLGQRRVEGGQVHSFLGPKGKVEVEVPYPPR